MLVHNTEMGFWLVQNLPAEDVELIRMHYWNEMSIGDIAKDTGVSKQAVSRRHKRVIGDLKQKIDRAKVSDNLFTFFAR